jgi:RNA polymerase sigma-70 factor (ECF subfamily)
MIAPTTDFEALSGATDERLMQRITERHECALEELFTRHGEKLKAVAGRLVHEEGETDDVLQECLLQIWRESARYLPKAGRPLGWITTLTKRRAIDSLRRKSAYRRAKERFESERRELPSGFHGPDEISRVDLRHYLREQVRSLPPTQCEAIWLAFFNGMSHREIARATRTPLGTVKTRLELGLRKLTQKIKPLRQKI